MEESSLFADITDFNTNSNSKSLKIKKVLFESPLNVIKYNISSTRVVNDVDFNTKLNLERLQTFRFR